MAAGIEHRNVDSVIQAYTDYDCPNFSIWSGKRLCVVYDDDNTDQGLQTLINYLNTILAANTSAVYMLKVYPEGTKANSGTNYKGSTTFMLSPTALTTMAPGPNGVGSVHLIDNSAKTAQYGAKEFMTRLEKLEAENKALLERLHTEQLNGIRRDFTAQIAGLQKVEDEKSGLDKFFDFLDKKPDVVDKIFDGMHKIAGIFRERKDYIQHQAGGSMAGTNHKSQDPAPTGEENSDNMETSELQLTSEGALINPLLTAEEMKLKKKEQSEILIARLTPISQDQHDDLQSECLEIIEKRVGAVTLSRMLLAVASLDNDDLNKLLNNLD